VDGGFARPVVDLHLDVPRVDFARLLATAGLDLPADDLGSATLSARVSGPLLDAPALRVTQRIDFTPPARPLPAIERLKGPFVHTAWSRDGQAHEIRVSPEWPEFVRLDEVPPLFVRALLIGEDAGFYGHPGIDLRELPVAVARNLALGIPARGASTIPQQLAKNLLLSRRKTLSRKLEEAALALLLDASLGKSRELEIYLNVIEWGPGVYGLRPAARHYFAREPMHLTPKQMAFLVSLVPGPIKYQRSIEGGVVTPFFEGLVATLLAKLRSVDALSGEEYAAALAEPLDLRVALPAGAAPTEETVAPSGLPLRSGWSGSAPRPSPFFLRGRARRTASRGRGVTRRGAAAASTGSGRRAGRRSRSTRRGPPSDTSAPGSPPAGRAGSARAAGSSTGTSSRPRPRRR
jgi:hypothetical protein